MHSWASSIRALTLQTPGLSIEDFDIISVIGRGFYGKVQLCKKKETNQYFAIKSVHKNRLIKVHKVHTVVTERNILVKLSHPFVVNIHFAFQNHSKVYIGLEYVPGGDLAFHLTRLGCFPLSIVRLYVAELVLVVNHLHEQSFIYRDIKPENILVDRFGHLKLTDFGLAKNLSSNSLASTFCGSPQYLAPEIIQKNKYSYPVDWWSLGILMYELLYGVPPFMSENQKLLFQKIINEPVVYPPESDVNACSLMSILLDKDPLSRAGYSRIISHPFFNGMSFNDVLLKKCTPEFVPPLPEYYRPTNFDEEFTNEKPFESIATPLPSEGNAFDGFSFIASDQSDESIDRIELSTAGGYSPTLM